MSRRIEQMVDRLVERELLPDFGADRFKVYADMPWSSVSGTDAQRLYNEFANTREAKWLWADIRKLALKGESEACFKFRDEYMEKMLVYFADIEPSPELMGDWRAILMDNLNRYLKFAKEN